VTQALGAGVAGRARAGCHAEVVRARLSSLAAWRWWPAVAAAAPFLALAAQLLLLRRDPVVTGDVAVLDLQALDAASLDARLGAYSRFGFRHPGPAMFYAVAPLVAASGRAPWALHAGGLLLVAAALGAAVAVVTARAGRVAGALAALVVLVHVAAVQVGVLEVPWNPLVIVPVLALFLVLAGAVDRPGPALAGAALSGSFLVQTHVGTALVVGAVGLVAVGAAAAGGLAGRGWWPPAGRARIATLVLAGLTVLAWLPPLADQLTEQPGNLRAIASFFLHGEGDRPTGPLDAAAYVGRELDVVRGAPYLGSLTPDTVGRGRSLVVLAAAVAAAAGLVAAAGRRGLGLAARLGAVTLVGLAAAVVALTRVVGEMYWYLPLWVSALVVPLGAGWAIVAADVVRRRRPDPTPAAPDPARRGPARAAHVPVAAAGAFAVVLTVPALAGPVYESPAFPVEDRYRADVVAARAMVDGVVDATDAASVAFDAPDDRPWPTVAGVVVDLERRGVDARVTAPFAAVFGEAHLAEGDEDVTVLFLPEGSPPGDGWRPLGTVAAFTVYSRAVVTGTASAADERPATGT